MARTPADQDEDRKDADVVGIDSVVDLDLDDDADDGDDYPPLKIRLGGQMFEITQPDAGLVMELGNVGNIEGAMALLFDEQWPAVRPLLAGKKPEKLFQIARSHAKHFDLDEQGILATTAPPTRAERRQARPVRRRRGR